MNTEKAPPRHQLSLTLLRAMFPLLRIKDKVHSFVLVIYIELKLTYQCFQDVIQGDEASKPASNTDNTDS